MAYETVEEENIIRALQGRKPLNDMEEMIDNFTNYVDTYKTQDKSRHYINNPDAFIADMLYGLGKSMSEEYEWATGYSKFLQRIAPMVERDTRHLEDDKDEH